MTRRSVGPLEIVRPRGEPSGSALLIHSWWGLTASYHAYAEVLAARGVVVGLADLFDGRVASSVAEARALRAARRREPAYRVLTRNLEELQDASGREEVGVVGFSMGGHWAVWLSQQGALPVRQAVLYYAARAGNFAASRSSYLAHFAAEDEWVSMDARRRMEAAIARAGRPYVAHDYPGTTHWFAEEDRPEYAPAAATTALERTVRHLLEPGRESEG